MNNLSFIRLLVLSPFALGSSSWPDMPNLSITLSERVGWHTGVGGVLVLIGTALVDRGRSYGT